MLAAMPATRSTAAGTHVSTRMPTTTDQAFGRRIRALRRAAGLTLHDIGEAVGVSGVQFQRYETGASRIAASRLLAICNVLGVQISTLIDEALPAKPGQMADARHVECLELARAFNAIADPTHRRAVIALARTFAGWQEQPAAGAAAAAAGPETSTAPPGEAPEESGQDTGET
jgi:transcriptional regulator with XRE-family HTH domain